jgi:hypothetical protein
MTHEQLIARLEAKSVGRNWMALCPGHADKKASLQVQAGKKRSFLKCYAGCTEEIILNALHLEPKDLFYSPNGTGRKKAPKVVATYRYTNLDGTLLYEKVRLEPKDFRFRRPNGNGGWIDNLGDVGRVLYNLLEVVKADSLVIVEGEKDADNGARLGICATTGGGASDPWEPSFTETLRGKDVVVIADADDPGRQKARQIAGALHGTARTLRVGELPAKDLSDWLAQGGNKEQLLTLSEQWPAWNPILLTAELVRDIEGFLSAYLVLPEKTLLPLAVWVLHTYMYPTFDALPYLVVTSPTKRCAKTRLLECCELIVSNPRRASNISEAALFRAIDKFHPTLMLDEAETLRSKGERAEYLRQILNAGNRRGAVVTRCVGEGKNQDIGEFSVFCPKMFAGIGDLPDTITDRAIPIHMQRKEKSQKIEKFKYRSVHPKALAIRQRAGQFADAQTLAVEKVYAKINLDFLEDREEEAWEPLFAVLSVADGSRIQELRECALHLSRLKQSRDVDSSTPIRLLHDLQSIWTETQANLSTTQILGKLAAIEDSPWVGLKPRGLCRMLRGFGVESKDLRLDGKVIKGYEYQELRTVFLRYLRPESATSATDRTNIDDS